MPQSATIINLLRSFKLRVRTKWYRFEDAFAETVLLYDDLPARIVGFGYPRWTGRWWPNEMMLIRHILRLKEAIESSWINPDGSIVYANGSTEVPRAYCNTL